LQADDIDRPTSTSSIAPGTTGEVTHSRERQIELTIRDGKVARYEMRIVG
jgi:hypothetical protein